MSVFCLKSSSQIKHDCWSAIVIEAVPRMSVLYIFFEQMSIYLLLVILQMNTFEMVETVMFNGLCQ